MARFEMKRLGKLVFLLTGILLLVWAMQKVDLDSVTALLLQMGWGFTGVLLAYGGVAWLDAISWKFAFKPEESAAIKTWELWRIRTIGEAFNAITPLGTMGGEPVKAQLLKERHRLSFKQGLASQVVARTTLLVALIVFLLPGTALLFNSPAVPDDFKWVSLTGLVIFSTLIFLFLLFQINGGLGKITSWFSVKFPGAALQGFLSHTGALDQMMSHYYKNHPQLFLKSTGFGWLGWAAGLLEVYLTLYFLGHLVGIPELWIIEALTQLVRVGSFFIPLSLGAQEGGLVLIFVALGLGGDLGLAVAFVRRLREFIWIGLGLLLGWGMAFKPSAAQAE